MSLALDQIFVHGKQWLLSWFAGAPNWLIQIMSSLINIVALLAVFLTLFALISVLECKILGRMQNGYGGDGFLAVEGTRRLGNRRSLLAIRS